MLAGLKVAFRGTGRPKTLAQLAAPVLFRSDHLSFLHLAFFLLLLSDGSFPLFRAVSLVLCSLPRFDFARTSSLEKRPSSQDIFFFSSNSNAQTALEVAHQPVQDLHLILRSRPIVLRLRGRPANIVALLCSKARTRKENERGKAERWSVLVPGTCKHWTGGGWRDATRLGERR